MSVQPNVAGSEREIICLLLFPAITLTIDRNVYDRVVYDKNIICMYIFIFIYTLRPKILVRIQIRTYQ